MSEPRRRPSITRYPDKGFQVDLDLFYSLPNEVEKIKQAFIIGNRLLEGRGIAADADAAFVWIKLAADDHYVPAWNILGKMYENGWGVKKDVKKAEEWYLKAIDAGNLEAKVSLGVLYGKKEIPRKNLEDGFQLFYAAAEEKSPQACLFVAECYELGQGVKQDIQAAKKWYKLAAKLGQHVAYFNLYLLYKNNPRNPRDNEIAQKYLQKAAEDKDSAAFALCELAKQNEKSDPRRAAELYQKAVKDHHNGIAAYQLALLYIKHPYLLHAEQELEQVVIDLYTLAAQNNQMNAQMELVRYYRGKDQAQWLKWLEAAAKNNHPQACFELAKIKFQSLSESKDALRLYQQAAAQNHLRSILFLANSPLIPMKDRIALHKKAIALGDYKSHLSLAFLYETEPNYQNELEETKCYRFALNKAMELKLPQMELYTPIENLEKLSKSTNVAVSFNALVGLLNLNKSFDFEIFFSTLTGLVDFEEYRKALNKLAAGEQSVFNTKAKNALSLQQQQQFDELIRQESKEVQGWVINCLDEPVRKAFQVRNAKFYREEKLSQDHRKIAISQTLWSMSLPTDVTHLVLQYDKEMNEEKKDVITEDKLRDHFNLLRQNFIKELMNWLTPKIKSKVDLAVLNEKLNNIALGKPSLPVDIQFIAKIVNKKFSKVCADVIQSILENFQRAGHNPVLNLKMIAVVFKDNISILEQNIKKQYGLADVLKNSFTDSISEWVLYNINQHEDKRGPRI